jgi:hypothetical protein
MKIILPPKNVHINAISINITRDASLCFGGQRFEIKLTAPFHYLTCKWKWYYNKFRTCTITMVYFYYYFNLIYCARLS